MLNLGKLKCNHFIDLHVDLCFIVFDYKYFPKSPDLMVYLESVAQLGHFSMFSMVWPIVLQGNVKMWFKENVEALCLCNIALFILASKSAQHGNFGSTNGRDLWVNIIWLD